MIPTVVINSVLLIINNILDVIPVIDIAFNLSYIEGFLGFINFCTYLFPIYALWPIALAVVSLTAFRIGISLIKTVLDVIPFV